MLKRFASLISAVGLLATVACAETDPGITAAVKARLAADDTVKAYQIDVDTASSVVTLTGTVDSQAAKDMAVTLARQTDGVSEVLDRITVNASAASSPDAIRDGVDATRDAAERGAAATSGAAGDAADSAGRAAERTGEVVSDAAVTAAVKTKVLADTSTPGLQIDVDTKDGVVTLSGEDPSRTPWVLLLGRTYRAYRQPRPVLVVLRRGRALSGLDEQATALEPVSGVSLAVLDRRTEIRIEGNARHLRSVSVRVLDGEDLGPSRHGRQERVLQERMSSRDPGIQDHYRRSLRGWRTHLEAANLSCGSALEELQVSEGRRRELRFVDAARRGDECS
jgi:osmotically-inducible protein OsmY